MATERQMWRIAALKLPFASRPARVGLPSHFDWMQIFVAYEKQLQYYGSWFRVLGLCYSGS